MHATPSSPPSEFSVVALPLAEREAIVGRFNQRVTAALLASPPTKQLVRPACAGRARRGASSGCSGCRST